MKKYGIYQFYVDQDASKNRERHVLVGFVKANDEKEAVNLFTGDTFKRGYLSAQECSDKNFEQPSLMEAIKKNRAKLGVWA